MQIQRDTYIQALSARRHNGLIKVITGLRRVGKSYLLFTLFYDYLKHDGVDDDHIIRIAFDSLTFSNLADPHALLSYLEERISGTDWYYLLLDEVQLLPNFEGVLNALLYKENVDIYVTGSNAKFLSHDVITEFRGRGDELHLLPLSFSEFLSAYPGHDRYLALSEYMLYGGLPRILAMETPERKAEYLKQLFSETYLLDMKKRSHIRYLSQFDRIIDIVASDVGSLTNPHKIKNTFESVEHSSLSQNTIDRYLRILEDAFLITGVQRYDVRGRRYIGSPLKYYFEDVGLRNARLNFRQTEPNYLMENVIYNELRFRGYNVDVGVVGLYDHSEGKVQRQTLEIDFVVNSGSKRYYIQSAFSMDSQEKIRQEKRSLLKTNDSFKKIIVVRDVTLPLRDESGVTTLSIYDFLLNPQSLDL